MRVSVSSASVVSTLFDEEQVLAVLAAAMVSKSIEIEVMLVYLRVRVEQQAPSSDEDSQVSGVIRNGASVEHGHGN